MGKTNEFAYYQSRRMPLEYVLNLQIGPAYIALLSRITRFEAEIFVVQAYSIGCR